MWMSPNENVFSCFQRFIDGMSANAEVEHAKQQTKIK
jgi:hypothetical protein